MPEQSSSDIDRDLHPTNIMGYYCLSMSQFPISRGVGVGVGCGCGVCVRVWVGGGGVVHTGMYEAKASILSY